MNQEINYIANSTEAKKIDAISIQEIGIPSMVLMEKAAMAVAACIMANSSSASDKIIAICGAGNNGGDGVAAVRLLKESGYDVAVLMLGQQEKYSVELCEQIKIAENLGVTIYQAESVTEEKLQQYTIIIDAIFGIGLGREISGDYARWITWINRSHARVIAVDIPSGIHASNGAVLGTAVQADMTITFGVNKIGLVLYPGMQYAGEVVVADIGFPMHAVRQVSPQAYTYDPQKIKSLLPKRKTRSNKGSYGRVLVIAGSTQMSGACYFAAEAAYRVGAGLVQVVTAEENAGIIRTKLPEAIVTTWSAGFSEDDLKRLQQAIDTASSIVIGPGLGVSAEAQQLVRFVLHYVIKNIGSEAAVSEKPMIIDADGLNLLAQMEEFFEVSDHGSWKIKLPKNLIITPHLKEMSRLIRMEVSWIASHMMEAASHHGAGCTIVLKDARTLVSDGEQIYINITGNHALAKGGSGDVLSGMIGGLLAQGIQPMEAAALAVCLHGMAADDYVQRKGACTMLASDILEEIPLVMK